MKEGSILFVTDKFPWPLDDGGQIRTYHVLKSLAAQFRVVLLSITPPSPDYEWPIRSLGVDVISFRRSQPPWLLLFYVVKALFTSRPYPLPKNFSREIMREVRRQIDAGNVHALHFNHLDAAQYLDWLGETISRVEIVFDTHNVMSSFYERLVRSEANPFRRVYCWIQWRKMRVYEKSVMRKAGCVVVCSDVERHLLDGWGLRKCLVAPNGVDTDFFTPDQFTRPHQQFPELVFIGALDYFPNAEGVRWFIRSVLPVLDRHLRSYRLTVAGKNPPGDLIAEQEAGRVEFTGHVDDVRPYIRSADVFVVPLRIGSGTRLKILEALAMGIPVVSTRLGAEGLELQDKTHLRIADNAAEMAAAVVEMCSRPELARQMAERGRAQVVKKYAWSNVTATLTEHYGNL